MVAECVLLPGDPLRAEHIAKKFFKNPVRYNETRGMYGYTGEWNGHRVSVQGTGMGMPSFSIYANELIDFFGCRKLIRVGTCGSNNPDLKLRDVFIAQSANTDSGMNTDRFGSSFHFAPVPSFSLMYKAYEEAKKAQVMAKKYWKELIRLLPESWLQKRTITMNYENILNMYRQRKNHKLTEWSKLFCDWVKTLPYAEELICFEQEESNDR